MNGINAKAEQLVALSMIRRKNANYIYM